jgi:hypothetical protein
VAQSWLLGMITYIHFRYMVFGSLLRSHTFHSLFKKHIKKHSLLLPNCFEQLQIHVQFPFAFSCGSFATLNRNIPSFPLPPKLLQNCSLFSSKWVHGVDCLGWLPIFTSDTWCLIPFCVYIHFIHYLDKTHSLLLPNCSKGGFLLSECPLTPKLR